MASSNQDSPSPSLSPSPSAPPSACPVDHTTRAAWLEATGASSKPSSETTSNTSSTSSTSATCSSTSFPAPPPPSFLPSNVPPTLSPHREISSIPRSATTTSPSASSPSPNSESPNDPHTSPSGHWIYPSEQMFFAAMRRKSWDPQPQDMQHIVPIHNAVNERAWREIRQWEFGWGSEKCGGPRLASFAGDSSRLSPKARVMVLLGYQRPFDRHDWTIDRCGKQIDYIIDFYSGKRDPSRPEAVSFYLDVRPKLNSLEGVMMRVSKFFNGLFSS